MILVSLFPDKSLKWFYNERHHGKGPMGRIGGTVKIVVFRKVKSNQVLIHSPNDFVEAVNKFIPSIHAVYLPENEMIVEPTGIKAARRIVETLKIHLLERKFNGNGDAYINFYKITGDDEPFHVEWFGKENGVVCGHTKCCLNENQCAECDGVYDELEEWLCCPVCHGFTRTVFISS